MKYELKEAIPILGDLLKQGKLNIFVGSGISRDSGLPDWNGLIIEFVKMASSLVKYIENDDDKTELNQIILDVNRRIKNERLEPIKIATVLKNKLKKIPDLSDPNKKPYRIYRSWLTRIFDKEPNEKHYKIIETNYPYILTSNYDSLLQDAAYEKAGINKFKELANNTLNYKDQTKILKNINENISSIIHVHGMFNSLEIDELIFTKEDYNKIISKKYEGFSFAIRMLFTRYSTLFVGYGANDPHLEEILEELAEYFPINDKFFSLPTSYLVTKRKKADTILEQYKGRVGTHLIIIDELSQYNELLESLKNIKPR